MRSDAPILLSGPMGSGKSTVGRALAAALGRSYVDLDQLIEERVGMSIRDLFAERGEAAFRRVEKEELRRVLDEGDDGGRVLSLGGGTVVDRDSRRRALEAGVLITLDAPVDVLTERVAKSEGRPLLTGKEARTALLRLLDERAPAYAECHGRVRTDRPVEAIVTELRALVDRRPIAVPLGDRSYAVDVAAGCRWMSPARLGSNNVLVVTDENVAATPWAAQLVESWGAASVVLRPGEANKNVRAIEKIWAGALRAGLDRRGTIVALGGGVVGDLAGFGAATYLRGVAFAQVPTTLLAMVDSSVGGKTGFDLPEGKNLVGAFHQPRWVLCDPATLVTLAPRELRAGLAEVVKSAWLAGEDFVSFLEGHADALLARDGEAIEEAVRRSVQLKAAIVSRDEQESGERRLLNLGHTVGHALEAAGGYEALLHGEAVALGMVAAFRVSRALGESTAQQENRMVALLERLELPTDLQPRLSAELEGFWARDKKRSGDRLGFIVPRGPGDVSVREVPVSDLSGHLRMT